MQRKFKRKNDYPVILRTLGFFSSSFGRKIHHPRFQDRMCGFSRFQERFSPKKALVLVIFLGRDLFSQRVADFELPIVFCFDGLNSLGLSNAHPWLVFRRYC